MLIIKSKIEAAQKALDNKISQSNLARLIIEDHTSCTNGEYIEHKSSSLVNNFSLYEHFKEHIGEGYKFSFVDTDKKVVILAEESSMSIETYSKVTIIL